MTTALPLDLLLPTGRILLLGSFGYSLYEAIRGEDELFTPIERLAIALVAIIFYQDGARLIQELSLSLESLLQGSSKQIDLREFILTSFKAAASAGVQGSGTGSINISSLIEQSFRTGVWGVMTLVVEFCFMLARFLIECGQAIFWKLLIFLFPVACGVYPLFPRILKNMVLYAIELSLWLPILTVLELITAQVARDYVNKDGSLGLYVIAIELIAILLTLAVPSITHRFLNGALSQDLGASGIIQLTKKLTLGARTVFVKGAVGQ